MNYTVKIDLKKLDKTALMNIQGKDGMVQCVVIPVKDNNIFVSDKPNGGIYLELKASEAREMKYGQSHFLKKTVSKEAYSQMTKDERMSMPIIGSLSPYDNQGMAGNNQTPTEQPKENTSNGDYDGTELPF